MIIDDAHNADRLIEFMESIVKDVKRKAFLVMDNLGDGRGSDTSGGVAVVGFSCD